MLHGESCYYQVKKQIMDAFDPFGSDNPPLATNLLAPVMGSSLNQGISPLATPSSAASVVPSTDLPVPILPMGAPIASAGEGSFGPNYSSATPGLVAGTMCSGAENKDYSILSSAESFSTGQSVFSQNVSSMDENTEAVAPVATGGPNYNYETASFEEPQGPFGDSSTAPTPAGNFANFEATLAPAEIVQTNLAAGLVESNKVSAGNVWC